MNRFATLSDDPRFQPLDSPAHRQMIDACKKDWLAGMDREELDYVVIAMDGPVMSVGVNMTFERALEFTRKIYALLPKESTEA